MGGNIKPQEERLLVRCFQGLLLLQLCQVFCYSTFAQWNSARYERNSNVSIPKMYVGYCAFPEPSLWNEAISPPHGDSPTQQAAMTDYGHE